jgi:hypothetical protein
LGLRDHLVAYGDDDPVDDFRGKKKTEDRRQNPEDRIQNK